MTKKHIDKKCLNKFLSNLKVGQFSQSVITGDENWFSKYYPETKRQSKKWNTPNSQKQKKPCVSK